MYYPLGRIDCPGGAVSSRCGTGCGNYKQTFSRFVGPTKTFVAGNTLQLKDYGATDWPWTLFDPEAKQRHHDKTFPKEGKKAHELGFELAQ